MVKIQLEQISVNGILATNFRRRVLDDGGTFEAYQCCIDTLNTIEPDVITGGLLDVKEETAFPLNFGVADVRDLTKRSGATSKTLTLSGTKNNHDLLNHYYDVNIQEGTFDINALTKCAVIQNGIPVMEEAYLQLLSVNKKQSTASYELDAEYEVMVKDSQADFFTKLDNADMSDLDMSDLNHTFDSATIVASFTNTVTDGYVYPINHTGDNWYPLKEMRPAIYAKQYWDRIHARAGFSYTWSTLSDAYFDKLVIPFNGDQLQVDWSSYNVNATRTPYTINYPQTTGAANGENYTELSYIDTWTETLDDGNIFDPVLGEYVVPIIVTTGESINFSFDVDYEINLINPTGSNAYLMYPFGFASAQYYQYQLQFRIYNNGVQLSGAISSINSTANHQIDTIYTLPSGTTTIVSEAVNVNVPASNLQPGDVLQIVAAIKVRHLYSETNSPTTYPPTWRTTNTFPLGTAVPVTIDVVFNSLSINVGFSSNIFASGGTFDVNDAIPRNVKQKEFIKSICTMYNLMAEPDKDNPNNIVYKHRDDYYDSGAEKDWTYKLAKERDHQLQFLPELSAKKLLLTYKEDNDEPNKIYLDTTREVYSQVEFTFDNEYVKGVDKKEIIFTPSPMGRNAINAITPMVNGAAPKTGIRILIHNGTATCDSYDIYDYGNPGTATQSGQTGLTSYPIVHHWDDPYNPSFSIEFGTNDYYFYDNYTITNNNLYNLYWRRTVNQINTGKMLTAYFDLNEADIQSLKLNDKIRIDNSWWHINKVIDYDPNVKQLTKVELMSVDSEIDFAPFKTRRPKFPRPQLIANATNQIKKTRFDLNNVNYSQGGLEIRGYGNIAGEGLKGFVQGDNKEITEDGIYADNIRNPLRIDTYNIVNKTATYTITDADYIVNCTANTFTVTLPTAVGIEGRTYVVKNSSKGVVTVDGDGTETIDEALTQTLYQYDSITVVSDGANWIII